MRESEQTYNASARPLRASKAGGILRLAGSPIWRHQGRPNGPVPEPQPFRPKWPDSQHWPRLPNGGGRGRPRAKVRVACCRSVYWLDTPVTLPPGRAKLATRPVPSGSCCQRENDRDDRCRLLYRKDCAPRGEYDIDLQTEELGRDFGKSLVASLGPAILDRDGAALDPTEFAQSLHKSGGPLGARARAQEPDSRQFSRLLPSCRKGPRHAAPPISVMNSRRFIIR